MINEIGTIKAVLAPSLQTSPTADPGTGVREASEAKPTEPVEAAEEANDTPRGLDSMVSGLNELVQNLQRELQFSVDTESGETVVKVIDRKTDEVVREIPSEELRALRRRLEDSAGVFFEDSA